MLIGTAVVSARIAPHVEIVIQGPVPTVPALIAAEVVRRLVGSFLGKDR
ncbi:hypothetical protein [Streptomyces sp. CA-111067]|jgi:hypothetical protein